MKQDTRLTIQESVAKIIGAFNRCVELSPNNFKDCQMVVEQADRVGAALSQDRIEEIEREGV